MGESTILEAAKDSWGEKHCFVRSKARFWGQSNFMGEEKQYFGGTSEQRIE
jgi:hypothetical protein